MKRTFIVTEWLGRGLLAVVKTSLWLLWNMAVGWLECSRSSQAHRKPRSAPRNSPERMRGEIRLATDGTPERQAGVSQYQTEAGPG
jgi:hypothetical protein